MQTQRNVKQWGTLFKRGFVLFCVFLLFVCIGLVLFLTSTMYARGTGQNVQSNNSVQPADTGTVEPTIVPTIAPTPTLGVTITPPLPTPSPTQLPTPQPTVPKPNPTSQPIPTATTIAGGLPPPGNNPTPQPTLGSATSPTPTTQTKTTPVADNPTAAATNTASSPITNTTTATTTQPNVANSISMGQIAAIVGASVVLGGTLFAVLVWRQRRMKLRPGAAGVPQRAGLYPQAGRAVTEPLHQSPQPLIPQVVPEMALAANSQTGSPMQYAEADMSRSMLREQGPIYQQASPVAMTMMQAADTPPQAAPLPSTRLLESMMRQAQMGLFALPDNTD